MRLSAAAVVVLAACGDNGAIDFGAPSTTFPAELPPVPQVVNGGGQVMTEVNVTPIYFGADDPDQAALDAFLAKLSASVYWGEMVQEYGVSRKLGVNPSVIIDEAPPANDDDLHAFVIAHVLPVTDDATLANTIFLLHFRGDQPYRTGDSGACSAFSGFHAGTRPDRSRPTVNVALVWSCETANLTLTSTDVATITTGHELVEAATDPQPNSGWGHVDKADKAWELHFGGEVADMCEAFPRRVFKPDDVGFFLQRSWSNQQMKGFHDPCVPHVPGDPAFFATVPVEPDVDAKGVRVTLVPHGGAATIDLQWLSDGPLGQDWVVEPIDEDTLDGAPPSLQFALDRNSGGNGNVAHLTITAADGATPGLHPYRLVSQAGGIVNVWLAAAELE